MYVPYITSWYFILLYGVCGVYSDGGERVLFSSLLVSSWMPPRSRGVALSKLVLLLCIIVTAGRSCMVQKRGIFNGILSIIY